MKITFDFCDMPPGYFTNFVGMITWWRLLSTHYLSQQSQIEILWEWLLDEDYFRQRILAHVYYNRLWEWLIDEDYFRQRMYKDRYLYHRVGMINWWRLLSTIIMAGQIKSINGVGMINWWRLLSTFIVVA